MAVFTPITKDEWMQNHFSEHFHDKVNKQALLELTLGINTIVRPDDPMQHGLNILNACKRAPVVVQTAAISHEQKISNISSPGQAGLFSNPSQEKNSQSKDIHTPTKKR